MQIKTGSYVGNGASSRAITGVGFQPSFVIVKGGANKAVVRTTTMEAAKLIIDPSVPGSIFITSLDANGFTVDGNVNVNSNGVTYYWWAVGDETSGYFKTLSYVGNNVDNRSIGGVGFQPDVVFIFPGTPNKSTLRTITHAAGESQYWDDTIAVDRIQAFEADGFQIGGDPDVNSNSGVYHAVCFKEFAGLLKVLTYTGNGTDNRSISGAGFTPTGVLIKNHDAQIATNKTSVLRVSGHVGDLSSHIDGQAEAADRVQAFEADGFQIGASMTVNENNRGPTHTAITFRDGSTMLKVGAAALLMMIN